MEQWKLTSQEFIDKLGEFLKTSSTNGEFTWDWLNIDFDDGGMTVGLTIWDLKDEEEGT